MARRSLRVALAMAALSHVAAPLSLARAQAPDDPRAYYERGLRFYKLADYEKAIVEFKRAYELSSAPELLFNIAQAYRLKGDCKQATVLYRNFLKDAPASKNRKEVDSAMEQCRAAEAAAPQPQPAALQPRATTPPPVRPTTTTPPRPVAQPSVALAPPPVAPVAPPVSTVEVKAEEPADPGRNKRLIGMGLAGTGVALVVTGAIFGAQSRSTLADVDKMVKEGGGIWNPAWNAKESKGRSAATAANVLFVGGTAALAAGGVLFYLGWSERGTGAIGFTPTPGGLAMTWGGAL